MLKRFSRHLAILAAALLLAFAPAQAQQNAYPNRPVTLLVAFTPGGPSDVLARIIGKRLNEILHQPFIIENRPGAGGNIAAEQVARAISRRLHAVDGQQQHPRHQRRAL